jgi:hypothetical protein
MNVNRHGIRGDGTRRSRGWSSRWLRWSSRWRPARGASAHERLRTNANARVGDGEQDVGPGRTSAWSASAFPTLAFVLNDAQNRWYTNLIGQWASYPEGGRRVRIAQQGPLGEPALRREHDQAIGSVRGRQPRNTILSVRSEVLPSSPPAEASHPCTLLGRESECAFIQWVAATRCEWCPAGRTCPADI